jgi:hypothetical protein
MRRPTLLALLVALLVLTLADVTPALAHQPYFEDVDTTADKPWSLADPTVSVALYFTLESATDVDYVAFEGSAGQSILVSMVIPQIAGQETFTPQVAVLGPGLSGGQLPAPITIPAENGAYLLTPVLGEAPIFFEPFSRTRYYQRQEERITLPADGRYVVAVWSDSGTVGRYTLAIGDQEIFGGDPAFRSKMSSYWQPLPTPSPTPTVMPTATPQASKTSGTESAHGCQ